MESTPNLLVYAELCRPQMLRRIVRMGDDRRRLARETAERRQFETFAFPGAQWEEARARLGCLVGALDGVSQSPDYSEKYL